MMDTKLVYMVCQQPTIRLSDFWSISLVPTSQFMTIIMMKWNLKKERTGDVIPTMEKVLLSSCTGGGGGTQQLMFHVDHMALHGHISLS